ncbi:unnamed protein product [Linum tenue]|uniref:Uncharacterized protein n=1 Tax=Linum tenue TaxID=586396 RepID=A0AAV0HMK0_9ROSI|nr:unnamed protein product [Linum tenue]
MSTSSPTATHLVLLLLSVLGLGFGSGYSHALKVPFRVNDVLPVLPRQIAWPVLNNLHAAVDLMPYYVGSVTPANGTIRWKGACFYDNEARIDFTHGDRDEPGLGGGVLYLKTLEKWVTGAFAGHTAVCLKDEQGNLWVGESGHENEKGEEVIAVIPWDEWWALSLKDDSNPQIALLPLHPDVRARFNNTAAWEYVRTMAGKPYGYHNMIFSWIDTIADNYPPPLDAHLVISVMSMWTRVQPAYAANMWNEALNKRLETEDLDLYGILAEVEKRGMSFDELLTQPEQDEWVYSDGKSTTCVAFILQMYKEAGLFDPIASSIQVTEFTIRDAYMLKIFENNQTRLPSWCSNRDGRLSFCQILGEYWMEFPEYNSIEPYAKMNENCPSLPPIYDRPSQC